MTNQRLPRLSVPEQVNGVRFFQASSETNSEPITLKPGN